MGFGGFQDVGAFAAGGGGEPFVTEGVRQHGECLVGFVDSDGRCGGHVESIYCPSA